MKRSSSSLRARMAGVALALVCGLGAAVSLGQTDPHGLPAGHPPVQQPPPGAAGHGRPMQLPPPGGPRRPQLPTDHVRPAEHAEHAAGGGHGEEHAHDPHAAPEWDQVNWWHGLIAVNDEAAKQGGINLLLWRRSNEPPPFLASLLNFGVLAFIIYRFGKKPIGEALLKRKQSIMSEIDNAAELKKKAEARLREYEEKFAQIEDTLEALKAEYAAQAEVEKKHVLADAEERRARMRRDAEFRIEQELRAARVQLLHEAVQHATAAAEEMIRKGSAQADHARIADEYLAAVRGAYAPAGAATTGVRS